MNTTSGEQTVWKGTSSQIVNLNVFILCLLACWLVVPAFIAVWKWLQVRCRVYELTTERLRIADGVLSKRFEDLELYRVRDMSVEQPFWLRLFGLGNVRLVTTDKTTPVLVLPAVAGFKELLDLIRTHVEAARMRKGTREVDVT